MTYVEFPYAVLGKLGDDLRKMGEQLAEAEGTFRPIDGLGPGHEALSRALDTFQMSRRRVVRHLAAQIRYEGGLARGIGEYVADFDAAVGNQIRALDPDSK